jgi:beta-glucosidase
MSEKWFEDGRLRFAVGVEDTFVPQTMDGHRSLDEYELTQHYEFWAADLALAADSGATMIRWGIPWHRINPAPEVWAWSWLDQVIDRLVELRLEPIIDLMHYGTPTWLDREFLHADYPRAVADYAGRVAERYADRITSYTPLNEPLVNAVMCGHAGQWPPYAHGDHGFVKIANALARGIVLTQQAISDALGDRAVSVHVEAAARFTGAVDEHADTVSHLRSRAFLIEDLVTGRVGSSHPLLNWLQQHGVTDNELDWHKRNVALPDVMGVNYYPALSTELFEPGVVHSGWPLDPRPTINEWTDGLTDALQSFADRYERPVFLTETCYTGTVAERISWLDASVARVEELRAGGLDCVGYTWWSLFDMVEWTYRSGSGPVEEYFLTMGLWELQADKIGALLRVRTGVADRFETLARHVQSITRG